MILFEQPWFTWKLLRDCLREVYIETLRREFRAALMKGASCNRTSSEQRAIALNEMEKCHAQYINSLSDRDGRPFYSIGHPLQHFIYKRTLPGGTKFLCKISVDEGQMSIMYGGKSKSRRTWTEIEFPSKHRACKRPDIPRRLLRAPWTQDKGNLLELILVHGAEARDQRTVRQGLISAINEACLPAIFTLTAEARFEGVMNGYHRRFSETLAVGWYVESHLGHFERDEDTWMILHLQHTKVLRSRPVVMPNAKVLALFRKPLDNFGILASSNYLRHWWRVLLRSTGRTRYADFRAS